MPQIAISKFKATCLAVLERVRRTGQPVLVTRRGEPIARVIPPAACERLQSWLGCMSGRARIAGDLVTPASEESDWEALDS
ncbi:MAG TPA: type II toxin-antitoxin system Phd/YefM family antitoxin [Acidobacteriota bacterium]|nr:type II toxin-antitoxin system Phd/YefM family antitoxin [Acidobacteriota bacterium]